MRSFEKRRNFLFWPGRKIIRRWTRFDMSFERLVLLFNQRTVATKEPANMSRKTRGRNRTSVERSTIPNVNRIAWTKKSHFINTVCHSVFQRSMESFAFVWNNFYRRSVDFFDWKSSKQPSWNLNQVNIGNTLKTSWKNIWRISLEFVDSNMEWVTRKIYFSVNFHDQYSEYTEYSSSSCSIVDSFRYCFAFNATIPCQSLTS